MSDTPVTDEARSVIAEYISERDALRAELEEVKAELRATERALAKYVRKDSNL